MQKWKWDQDDDDRDDDDDHDDHDEFDTLSQYFSSESLRDKRFIWSQSCQRNYSNESQRYFFIINLISIDE